MIDSSILKVLEALPGGKITAFIILLVGAGVLFQLALMIILRIAQFLVGKTKTTLDDRILRAISKYLPVIAGITSLWIAVESIYPGVVKVGNYGAFEIYVILLLSITGFLLSSIADAILVWYGLEIRTTEKKDREEEIFPFVRNVVKIGIIMIFVVFILQRLGFETTAIVTGLGVGGLAVALALQDTLSNFFGGLHILIDKPFKEEDYIKMENGPEGTVKQISWRTTRLRTSAQNEIIVPNSKLSSAVLENYSSPNQNSGVYYTIGVGYEEDPEQVEQIIKESILRICEKTGLIEKESVWARFDNFGDFSLNFKFGYLVKGYLNRWEVLKIVNREILINFRKEKIEIPYPIRTIRYDEGSKTNELTRNRKN